MPPDFGLKIVIGADASALEKEAKKARRSLAELKDAQKFYADAAFGEKDLGKLKEYNKGLQSVEKQIGQLSNVGKEGFDELGNAAVKSGNLGTKAFSALRTAANVLPGIGIAGILAFATEPLINYITGVKEVTEAMKKLESETEDIAKSNKSAFEFAGKEGAEVANLIAILKSETDTRERKNQALKDLKELNPVIFGQLQLENGAVTGLNEAYDRFLANLQNVVKAKLLQAKIEKILTDLIERQSLAESAPKFAAVAKQIQGLNTSTIQATGAQKLFAETNKNLVAVINKDAAQKIKDDNDQLKELIIELSKVSPGLELNIDKGKAQKVKDTIQDVLGDLNKQLDFLSVKGIALGIDQAPAKISAILSTIDKLLKDFKVNPDDTIIKKLLGTQQNDIFGNTLYDALKNIDALKGRKLAVEKIKAIFNFNPGVINIPATALTIDTKGLRRLAGVEIGNFGAEIGITLATTIGDSLGKALAGQASGSDILSGLFGAIGQELSRLGDLFIKAGAEVLIFKKLLALRPEAAIAAGIALKILGSFVQAKTSRNFATGGYVSGPGTGTSDSISANLSNGEFVLRAQAVQNIGVGNLNRLNKGGSVATSIPGGGTIVLGGELRARGSDLLLVMDRAEQTRQRNS